MRELKMEEMRRSGGGCVLTPAIVTGVIGIVAGTIWLTNSIVNLYLYRSTGHQPAPTPNLGPTIGQDLQNIADASKLLQ